MMAAVPEMFQSTQLETTRLPSLLVIEDDLSMIHLFDAILDRWDGALTRDFVASGEEAIELLKNRASLCGETPYSLILADVFLEGELTGFDVWLECQQLYPKVPFVLTSFMPHRKCLSVLQGAQQFPIYLPKPINIDRCLSIFKEYLGESKSKKEEASV